MIVLQQSTESSTAPKLNPSSLATTPRAISGSKPIRVLLAEDQEVNQIVASELLAEAGIAFDVVGDGRQAVEAVRRTTYDLVLMDCQMPEMDGFQATRAIRQWELDTAVAGASPSHLPIIALTANTGGGDRERCLEVGMDGHCGKPFSSQQLLKAIAAHLPEIFTPAEKAARVPDEATPQTLPFDREMLLQRCSGKAALAATILEKFEKQATSAMSELQQCVLDQDAEKLARTAHAIKGTAGIVAADTLRAAAARLEDIGREQTMELAGECLEQVGQEVERCVAYMTQVRTELATDDAGSGRKSVG